MHPDAQCRSGHLALTVYHSISGEVDRTALLAAAAVELCLEASFLFDDIADGDLDSALALSPTEEMALAIALLNTGIATAGDAVEQAGPNQASSGALQGLLRHCISSSAGLYQDGRLVRRNTVTTEAAMEMTERKSGSCGRLAASFGAAIATQDQGVVRLFGDFGSNLYTHLQLVDDIRDAYPKNGIPEDIVQQKKTVPLTYIQSSMDSGGTSNSDGIMTTLQELGVQDYRRSYEDTGAGVFSAVVAEAYLNRARSNLTDLSHRLRTVENLAYIVETIELSPQEYLLVS